MKISSNFCVDVLGKTFEIKDYFARNGTTLLGKSYHPYGAIAD